MEVLERGAITLAPVYYLLIATGTASSSLTCEVSEDLFWRPSYRGRVFTCFPNFLLIKRANALILYEINFA